MDLFHVLTDHNIFFSFTFDPLQVAHEDIGLKFKSHGLQGCQHLVHNT